MANIAPIIFDNNYWGVKMSVVVEDYFYRIDELPIDWNIDLSRIKRWLIEGRLKPHLWLPIMTVYRLKEFNEMNSNQASYALEHYEGFTPVSVHQCRRLLHTGKLTLRNFTSSCGKIRYELPDTAEDILIRIDDLIVLPENRKEIENQCELGKKNNLNNPPPDFMSLVIDEKRYFFTEMQASIFEKLYNAAKAGKPWLSGKKLLHEVGSKSLTMGNFFKNKPIWKKIILSNRQGGYRIIDGHFL